MPEPVISNAERLASIETKLDQALPALVKHEDRLSSLERWRAAMIGAAVATGGGTVYLLKSISEAVQ